MKKSFKAALMAMLCFAGAGGTVYALTATGGKTPVKKGAAPVAYTYNLSTSTGARNAANWTLATGSVPSCGTVGEVPCKVLFDSSVYPTLQAYIDAQHFTSDAEVAYGPGVVSKQ